MNVRTLGITLLGVGLLLPAGVAAEEALGRITMVADDLELDSGGWTCGKEGQSVPVSQGLPTTLVSRLTVGGEDA